MPVASGDRWQVDSLHWDASTTILAVGLSILSPTNTANTSNLHATTYVQLYTRGNYHWYLKQQFSGCDLRCLGFDSEVLRRLYCTQLVPLQRDDIVEMNNEESSIPDDAAFSNVIRMVDLGWDVCSSLTEDASVAVLDGRSVLLTPMGIIVTPPPMSTYKVTLPSVCNYATFAKPCSCVKCHSAAATDVDASVEWMLACLCDDATLHIVSGDKKGSSSEPIAIKFLPELCRLLGCNATEIGSQYFSFKSVVLSLPSLATCDTFNVAITYYDHGRFLNPEKASIENQCNVLTLQIYRQYFSIANAKLLVGFEGSIARLVNCPVNCQRFLAGVVSNSGFEIQTVGFSFKHKHMSDHNRGDEDEETCVSVLSTYVDSILLPEVCYLLTAVVDSSSSHQLRNSDSTDMEVSNTEYDPMSDSSAFAVIGLSPRNRLYCGEVLLVAGASSFALNDGLGILTYISVGTRPALHYISVPALIGLSALHGQHLEEQYFLECGEARPLERGSRLVASVSGQPKTVVQMPRGNLETFEPRPLILMKARKLLERKQIYDCLVLFRRQKVDLNYLVDHDPTVFFNNVSSFVRETMKSDPEYLSLFISSLEPGNASVIKYPIAIVGRLADQPVVKPRNDDDRIAEGVCWKDVRGQSKVDTVCRAIRVELLQLLQEHPGALQPLLCTYARQQPPLLEDALAYISRHYSPIQPSGTEIGTQAHNKDRATVLSSTKVQSAIKYLAFLAEGSKLFEAALGVCDFQMARAVARLCQMDPKQYVPLIEKFESISQLPTRQSTAHHSFYDAITRFEVNYHLNRKEKCVTAGIDVIVAQINIDINIAAASFSSDSNKVDSQIKLKDDIRTLQSIIDIVFKMVCDNDLYLLSISQLDQVVRSLNSIDRHFLIQSDETASSQQSTIELMKNLLRRIRVSYGTVSVTKQKYDEAVTAFLSADPPAYPEAIRAARLASDWRLVLTLTGRQATAEGVNPFQRLQKVAAELVSAFRESQEQGDGEHEAACSVLPSYLNSKVESNTTDKSSNSDRALEAAQLSLEYHDDVETATGILLSARKWNDALYTVMKKNRTDLLMDEVTF